MRKSWILSLALLAPLSITGTVMAGDASCDAAATKNCGCGDSIESACGCKSCVSDDCCSSCDPYWIVGTEMTFLSPDFENNAAAEAVISDAGGPLVGIEGNSAFDDFTYAPRIWVGRQGEDWGIVGRFWYLSDSQGVGQVFVPGVQLGFNGWDRLKAYTTDLELTRVFERGCGSKTTLSGGFRYASLDSAGGVSITSEVGADLATAFANTNSGFDGAGITFAINNLRPLNCHGLNFFWGLRGSVLFGDSTAGVTTGALVATGAGTGSSFNGAFVSSDEQAIFIGEGQAGIEWQQPLAYAPATAFVRIAGEFQWWSGGDNIAALSTSTGFVGTTVAAAEAVAGQTDLTLAGFAIGTGLTW